MSRVSQRNPAFAEGLANPQPGYQALLDEAAAIPGEGSVVAVSRAAVEEVLRAPDRYSAGFLSVFKIGNVRPLIPLQVDPPDHLKYRRLLDPLFAPKRMDALEDDIATRVNALIDAFVARGECDFTDDFAVPLPSSVFLDLMGLPYDDVATFLRMKDGIIRPGFGAGDISDAERERIQDRTGQDIYEYFDAVLDERQRQPRDDILSQFLAAEVEGERLTREDILDICFLFLIAGLDTVTGALTCSYAFLAQHPTHRQAIVDDPAVIPNAVEELLRWESPVAAVVRVATGDTDLLGCPVTEGAMVEVKLGPANLDPVEHPEPHEVRFDREVNRHLAFGAGVHRCLGSHLARRELRVALREWHRRIPEYRLTPGRVPEFPPGVRTAEHLHLTWDT